MIEWITLVFGQYTREAFSLILTFLESQLAISLFCRRLRTRDHFPLRIVISFCECFALSFLLAIWKTEQNTLIVRIICYLLLSGLNVAFTVFCWDDSPEELLLAFSSGTAAYQIGNKLFPLLQNLRGINDSETVTLFTELDVSDDVHFLIFLALRVLTYVVLLLMFRRKGKLDSSPVTRRRLVILTVSVVAVVNLLTCIARYYEPESFALNIIIKLFVIMFSFMLLMLGHGIFSGSQREQELGVLRELRKQDKLQFESVKASMEMINMKCHDLKHIFRRIENKLTEEEAAGLKEAMTFYDSSIKTGSDVMDIVLCEKKVLCEKNGIRLSIEADGSAFGFLSATETYSLFGNIIDNAIEAVKKLSDPEQKLILIYCGTEDGAPTLEEMNYYSGDLTVSDEGLPSTSKQDAARHGYGTRSIRYIAEQHGGVLEFGTEGNMFSMKLIFPKIA